MYPVAIFKFYIDELNEKCNDLWQRPRRKVHNEDPVWYDNALVGRDTLKNVMKDLSLQAGLIGVYTNHSI